MDKESKKMVTLYLHTTDQKVITTNIFMNVSTNTIIIRQHNPDIEHIGMVLLEGDQIHDFIQSLMNVHQTLEEL